MCRTMREVADLTNEDSFETFAGTLRPRPEYWWRVGTFTDGELWMNNEDGYMYLKMEHHFLVYNF